jgi:IS4 transposase
MKASFLWWSRFARVVFASHAMLAGLFKSSKNGDSGNAPRHTSKVVHTRIMLLTTLEFKGMNRLYNSLLGFQFSRLL